MAIDASITGTPLGAITGTVANADDGTINGTIGCVAVGTLSSSVGVPGPQGPAGSPGSVGPQGPVGPAGQGVPAGGTAGQFLQKIDGVSYNTDWVTLNLSAYAPLNSPLFTGDPRGPTAALGDSDTSLATTAFVQQELASGTAVAKNLEVLVRNQSGSTIAAGSIVYISGATGNKPLITLAQANNDANSAQTMGFVKTAIANNGTGYVIVRGELENIDTSALTEGVQLYLSPTTPGAWTTTKPSAPQHLVYVGIVIRSHPTQGVILVAVQNGYELNELHDVAISSPTNGQVLKYNSSTGLWYNGTDSSGVAWGGITGTLSAQTDLQTALDGKYSTSNPAGYITSSALSPYLLSATAASTYQTIAGMSSYLTTSAAASTYYPLTNPSGYITSSALTGYATESWVTSQGYLTSSNLTPYALLSGASFTGEVVTPASTTSSAGFMLTPGVAPTTPVNGEFWATTTDLQVRLNGTTETLAEQSWVTGQGYITSSALTPYAPLAGATFTGLVNTVASTTTTAGFRIPHGTAPTAPVNGDIWTTTTDLLVRLNGTTRTMVNVDGTQTISGSKTFSNVTLTFGNSTAASTVNIATGATISASTKTVNIGTSGVAGSTTNITIGSTTGTSTTTLQGNTNGVTQSAGNSTTLLATTAFVTTADNLKANLASPTFTGTPAAPTAATDTNTTQLATTAYVVGQAGSATPLVDGTAAVGTSLRYARQDHVHPTDTSRAALASPTFTGTPAAPTAAVDTNTTQLATTAYVIGQAASATPLVDGTAAVGTSLRYARQDHVHPTDTSRAPLASPALTGTPTAPTATAGTNTTQIATTAFVTAAVPTVASLTETRQFSNATKISPPLNEIWAIMSQDYIDLDRTNFTYTTTGTPQWNQVGSITTNSRLNATAASSVIGRPFGTSQVDQVSPFLFRENWASNINFNKKTYLSGRAGSFALISDATWNQAFYFGKVEGDAIGDLTRRGFGWRWSGGTGSRFVNLVVHNGTTQTTVQSSFAVTQEIAFDWDLYSDGAGNVTLYINGTQVATSNAGPTSYQSAGTYAWWREEAWTTGVPSFSNHTSFFRGGRAAILNY